MGTGDGDDKLAPVVPEQSGDIVWAQLPTATNAPSPRSGHSFTIVPATREVNLLKACVAAEAVCETMRPSE